MKILKPLLPAALFGLAVFALAGITAVGADPGADRPQADPESDKAAVDPLGEYDLVPNKDHPGFIARVYKWTKDIARFDAGLRQLVATAKVPSEEEIKKRLESKTGDLEIITDGYGGVVDFDAAEGTVQYVVNERFGGINIEWEFELANDTEIHWNKSIKLIPKIARPTKNVKQYRKQPFFTIRIAKTDAGPFLTGDRVRIKASIDDFSRFRKDCSRAFGLVAIYYLEEAPNPMFLLKLDEAEVTLIKGAHQDAGKSGPAKSEGTPKSSLAQEKRDDSSDAKVELSVFGEAAGDPGAIREVPPKRDELEKLLGAADKKRLTYSPDKKLLAHLDGHVVTVWSVEERRQLHRLVLEGKSLAVAAFSPDGGSLVTADGEPQEAEKQTEEVARQPYMDELPDEVSAMAGLWRIDPDLVRLLETPAENNRHPNSLRLSFAVPGAEVLCKETIALVEDLFVKKMKHTIIAVGNWEAEKDFKLAADRDSNCFVTTKIGTTYMWFGTPDKSLVGSKVSQVWVSRRKQLLILDTNSMLPPRMRKPENVRAYRSVYWNESPADESR